MAAADERTAVDPARLEAASAWRVRLTEEGPQVWPGLQQWLDEHPDNAVAWRLAEELWSGLGDLASEPVLLAARRVALTRAQSQVVAWWAPTSNAKASPLHRLLLRGPAPDGKGLSKIGRAHV